MTGADACRIAGLFAAVLFAAAPPPGRAEPGAADGGDIGHLENLYSQSFVTGDASVAERLLADDFIGFGPDGETWDKAAMLHMVRSTPHQASARITSITVRRHGETAIALGAEDDVNAPAMTVSHRRWLDTWRRSAQGWRMIASAEIEPKAR